ncbi:hypothetical protein VNO77_27708 [Canavalia gladiata]|uniref:Uncharacterized protein n=1 Tax=Canavalia gladiata TaxID=3824 RepID=A0AAN9Q6Q7_CANGL
MPPELTERSIQPLNSQDWSRLDVIPAKSRQRNGLGFKHGKEGARGYFRIPNVPILKEDLYWEGIIMGRL